MSDLDTARLRAARERFGLQQIELSRQLGHARGVVGEWERGTRMPTLAGLKNLSKALRVSTDWLLGLDSDTGASRNDPPLLPTSAQVLLDDVATPPGLRDLAGDDALCEALAITPDEWAALASLRFQSGLTRDGYAALVLLLRTGSIAAERRRLGNLRGRRVAD